jgi:Mrp family chromosome partitioning ATPase
VLTLAALAQLRESCDLIQADASHCQVVRVASDVGSRYAKTQTAAQLAYLLAQQDDAPVLLLEADSDAPALHRVLQIEAPPGLGFSEQLQRIHERGGSGTVSVVRIEGNLPVLIESRVSSPEALGFGLFADAIAELRKRYKYIVVDGPVIDVWPDVEHLAHCTDALLMVTAAGTRAQDPLSLAERHFPSEMVIGVISAGDWSATG